MWNARDMPRYVALLRGINVGSRNRVAMSDLRRLTEALGHSEVATYIQSRSEERRVGKECVP